MNQRLVWNFEFSESKLKGTPRFNRENKDEIKWEVRHFWPSDKIITLNPIDPELVDLSHYERKFKDDCYYLVPKKNYNIKLRHDELLYKPTVDESKLAVGFGPKVELKKTSPSKEKALFNEVKKNGIPITVKKEEFVFEFPTTPTVRLELSRLVIKDSVFFSLCVEGRSLVLVETISKELLQKQEPSEYVKFLKKIVKA
jgi:hypothetical protein